MGPAVEALAARAGFIGLEIAASLDDDDLNVVIQRWDSVGAYRRALSNYEVKLHAVPLLATAADESTAFEAILTADAQGAEEFARDRASDARTAGPA